MRKYESHVDASVAETSDKMCSWDRSLKNPPQPPPGIRLKRDSRICPCDMCTAHHESIIEGDVDDCVDRCIAMEVAPGNGQRERDGGFSGCCGVIVGPQGVLLTIILLPSARCQAGGGLDHSMWG